MKTIFKYPICSANFGDSINKIEVPKSSKYLSIGIQDSQICAWYEVDTDETETRQDTWYQLGTGHPFEPEMLDFKATLINNQCGLVWHMFLFKTK